MSHPRCSSSRAATRPASGLSGGTLPSFLVIGAGKSGTTSVDKYLHQHPEVFMSPVKEPNFFALVGTTVDPNNPGPERQRHYPQAVTEWDAYRKLFAEAPTEAAIGEVSPMYLYDPRAPANIHRYLGPDVRLVAFLRQPAERLFSRWQHLLAVGHPPPGDIRDALDPSSIWRRRPDLVPEGFYGAHLSRYVARFPRAHIKVFLFEDLVQRPRATMQALYQFIGVDSSFEPIRARYNNSHRMQHPALAWALGRNSDLKRWVAAAAPALIRRLRDAPSVQYLLDVLRRCFGHRDALDPVLRRRLTRTLYADDIRRLEALLGRSLASWR